MPEQGRPPPGGAIPRERHAADLAALEAASAALEQVRRSLRLGSHRLVDAASDPGEPPAGEHVVDLQQAAGDALRALSGALGESAALLSALARRHRVAEAEVERVLRRADGGGP